MATSTNTLPRASYGQYRDTGWPTPRANNRNVISADKAGQAKDGNNEYHGNISVSFSLWS